MSSRTFGLIPAAGKSLRMGRPKLLLPLGGRTILERVIDALGQGGVDLTLVVVGPSAQNLAPVADAAGAHTLVLAEDTADMRATIVHGLEWLEQRQRPLADDDLLILPGDHPAIDARVIQTLVRQRALAMSKTIVVPTHQGRRGHPLLIAWQHAADIRAIPSGQGLNHLLRQHADQVLEVAVDTPSIADDVDTPEDYERLQKQFEFEKPSGGSGASPPIT